VSRPPSPTLTLVPSLLHPTLCSPFPFPTALGVTVQDISQRCTGAGEAWSVAPGVAYGNILDGFPF
jgi:hypothetical protein